MPSLLPSLEAVEVKESERRIALVIGIDDYQEVPKLKAARADAELMKSTLENLNPPFEVISALDSGRADVEKKLGQFRDKAQGAECALIYFAGHGVEREGKNYLLAADTDTQSRYESPEAVHADYDLNSISMDKMLKSLLISEASLKLLILDACRNDPNPVIIRGKIFRAKGGGGGLRSVKSPRGMMISYSADVGEVANDGLFTAALTRNIRTPNLPLERVFRRTRDDVESTAEVKGLIPQSPAEYNKLSDSSSHFFFQEEITVKVPEPADMVPEPDPGTMISQAFEGPQIHKVKELNGIRFLWCPETPPGGVVLGSDENEASRDSDETKRTVQLTRGFWLAETECTQAQWDKVMGNASNRSEFRGANLPLDGVTHYEATIFCNKLSKAWKESGDLPEGWLVRLPTEAQWEYACRAGTSSPFSFGSTLNGREANCDGEVPYLTEVKGPYRKTTVSVGSFRPNPWGFYDMHGNVSEWCADFYGREFPSKSLRDPTGPKEGDERVWRGGSWGNDARRCRSAFRGRNDAGAVSDRYGFRPAIVAVVPGEVKQFFWSKKVEELEKEFGCSVKMYSANKEVLMEFGYEVLNQPRRPIATNGEKIIRVVMEKTTVKVVGEVTRGQYIFYITEAAWKKWTESDAESPSLSGVLEWSRPMTKSDKSFHQGGKNLKNFFKGNRK